MDETPDNVKQFVVADIRASCRDTFQAGIRSQPIEAQDQAPIEGAARQCHTGSQRFKCVQKAGVECRLLVSVRRKLFRLVERPKL
ncbi:hypothetical protein AJ87_08300 [Rhizobium yanglingense]|nr:hypothetical protein AJ87_08300 [Rhizobium yanglingense]